MLDFLARLWATVLLTCGVVFMNALFTVFYLMIWGKIK